MMNTDPGFYDVKTSPTVAQPMTPANSQRIQFVKEYLFSINGILRVLIIVIIIFVRVNRETNFKNYLIVYRSFNSLVGYRLLQCPCSFRAAISCQLILMQPVVHTCFFQLLVSFWQLCFS